MKKEQLLESEDLHEILGIAEDTDQAEIKKAYFSKIKEYSPDLYPEEFKKIRAAYENLKKAKKKRRGNKKFKNLTLEEQTILQPLDLIQEIRQSKKNLTIKQLIKLTF